MNILVVANDFPTTSRMAGSPRLFNLCRELSKQHRLVLAHFARSPEKGKQFSADPDNTNVFSRTVELPLVSGFDRTSLSWLKRQYHRIMLEPFFSQRLRSPEDTQRLRKLISLLCSDEHIDIIYVDGIEMVQYLSVPAPVPVAVDLCDCLSLLYYQQSRRAHGLLRKTALFLEAQSIARWEKRIAGEAALTLVISTQDESSIKQLNPSARTLVVQNGVDPDYFAPSSSAEKTANWPKLIFTGVMGYAPNADAAVYFAYKVFPEVRKRFPDAEFWVVGASPPPWVLKLAEEPGVQVTGRVEDVRDYLKRADIFVCPLRLGTGMKNKIMAAMSMGLPVIATANSLNGLDFFPEEDLLEADSAEQFVEQIARLQSSPQLAAQFSQRGRETVINRYSWATHAAVLEEALTKLLEEKTS